MKNVTPWFLLLSLILGMPTLALAQDSGTSDTSTVGIETTSLPVEGGINGNTSGQPLPPKLPRPGSLNGLPPGQPIIQNMMERRTDGATGTGQKPPLKNMLERRPQIGTSGKPVLPPNMRGGIDDRMRGASGTRPFASGTPKEFERMKLLKDGKMDRQMEAARAFIQQAGERMRHAIERLSTLSGRLDKAIVKFKEKGVDTTNAEALLTIAKTRIGEATVAVASAMETIDAAKPGTTGTSTGEVREATRKSVKDSLEKAKGAIEAAHKALVEVVKSLKAAGGVGHTSSSSVEREDVAP